VPFGGRFLAAEGHLVSLTPFPQPTRAERGHRRLAYRLVSVRRRPVLDVSVGQAPEPRPAALAVILEDAADACRTTATKSAAFILINRRSGT
jgi:hypothetical protein